VDCCCTPCCDEAPRRRGFLNWCRNCFRRGHKSGCHADACCAPVDCCAPAAPTCCAPEPCCPTCAAPSCCAPTCH
jgi:hypothetical protein